MIERILKKNDSMSRFFSALVILVFNLSLTAQVPANLIGNNAPGLKWHQINTSKVRIIFPSTIDTTGQRVAQVIHTLLLKDDQSVGGLNQKTSIVLHSQSAISNGFVTVGPFRSEFFPIQRVFGNSTDYIDLLTLHEYRHIQQFANATHGITKLARKTLGSWAWGGLMATALPRWYFEGDAVYAETEFSASGRGRLPAFLMQYNALYNEDVIHSYEKASAGSLIDYVPDWYPLGYNIIKYGRENFGDDLWSGVVEDAVRYKGVFYSFTKSLKKRTGLTPSQMYQKAFQSSMLDYKAQIDQLQLSTYQYVAASKSKYISNYIAPKIYLGDTILVKSSLDQLPFLVKVTKSGEHKLCEIGRQVEGNFLSLSIGGNVVAWAEFANDLRWRYRQYSDIYLYDLKKEQKKRLTSKKRYFSPSVGQDGKKVAAISVNEDLSKSIDIISAEDGITLHSLASNIYSQLMYPTWIDHERLVVVATTAEQSLLVLVDLENESWLPLSPPSTDQLSHPFVRNGKVYFSSSYSDINNIYKVDLKDLRLYKLTEVPVGAFHPFVTEDEQWLLYSELERNGMKSKKTMMSKQEYFEVDSHKESNALHNAQHKRTESLIDELIDTSFQITKFNKWTGILNPHSLLPQFAFPTASLTLRSDNVFGTLSAQGGGRYNFNENEATYFLGLSYAELFPIVNVSYAHSYRSAQFFNFQNLTDTTSVFTSYGQRWLEDRLTAGITIPLNLSSQNLNSRLRMSLNYQTAKLSLESTFEESVGFRDTLRSTAVIVSRYDTPIKEGRISTIDIGMSYFAVKRQARLLLNPKWGGALSFRYRKQLGQDLTGGDVFNLDATLYFPGLHSTHSLSFNTAYQKESVFDNYRYSDIYNYSRGYDVSLRRDEFFKINVNYSLPLWYPDRAIGPLAFLKRIKANCFYDYGRLSLSSDPLVLQENMHSTGLEIGFDLRVFRLVEVDLGFRYSYVFNPSLTFSQKRHQFDFFVISITQ